MANCNHKACKPYDICGFIAAAGDGKNPGGNIHTTGQLHRHKSHKIYGWHSPEESAFYNRLVQKLDHGTIVEVGVYGGASLLGVIDSCIQTGSHIYGIDPWEKVESANGMKMSDIQKRTYRDKIKSIRISLENIIKAEHYDEYITLIHELSESASQQFDDASVDVIFIDGDHSYDAVYNDLSVWLPKLKTHGTIWGDDFGWQSVQSAVKDFCKDNRKPLRQVCGGRAWVIR
jgi:predicted O-methyltransferase YrrM